MENKIQEQVKRFVELSLEFTVDSEEVYKGFTPTNSIYSIGCNTSSFTLIGGEQPVKPRLEQYKESLERDAAKADRYEEYTDLQSKLKNYFNSLEKLSK